MSVSLASPSSNVDLWFQFLEELRELLSSMGVDVEQAQAIAADIHARAQAFSSLPEATATVLLMPGLEECFNYEPQQSSDFARAKVNVVVRNSALELAHSTGILGPSEVRMITTQATAPLNFFLDALKRGAGDEPLSKQAAGIRAEWSGIEASSPRAWQAWQALVELCFMGGGRVSTRQTPGSPSPLKATVASDLVEYDGRPTVKADGMDPRFDDVSVLTFEESARPGALLWVSSLSRFARNLVKQAQILDYLLGHGAEVLTTNYLLRPREVSSRKYLIPLPECLYRPPADLDGLSGVHRKIYRQLIKDTED